MNAFQPDPLLLNFILLKEIAYLPALAILALLRVLSARAGARWAAGLALLLAVLGAAALLGPAMTGMQGGTVTRAAMRAGDLGGGMALPLIASAPMLVSSMLPGTRWRWIDALHILLLGALLGLWLLAR
ncbi:hypothetical protein SAMN05216196_101301 [Lutimaribacter pacificus]|uniref:Uncharacterized protein n=1 Tax=Lutimaribacter pacificus TaxID=391948 RepID=A0A1H0AU16_9RHOB|nr:hypothetical protein [Lutimaribacter pacificus]SDN36891.1 hypothetical protein SAMN05216196_101301 [Lutimaribacter pacificus]SHJ64880.1 hypothetical protein SAMN05444142_101916 [Lutimaribacter pacificus]